VPIQAPRNGDQVMRGYPAFAHEPTFVDYSHGVRLVWPTMKVDGAERRVADVLRDANLGTLIAAEAPINDPRYTLDRAGHAIAARSEGVISAAASARGGTAATNAQTIARGANDRRNGIATTTPTK